MKHIKSDKPVWIHYYIINKVWKDKAVPVFLPVILVTAPVFFKIAGNEKEDGNNAGLQITVVEPFLGLWQVAEHHSHNRKSLPPVYPVDSPVHDYLQSMSNWYAQLCTG